MTDHSHLDNFVDSTSEDLSRKLLEAFRQMVRACPDQAVDYSARLKALMEAEERGRLDEYQKRAAAASASLEDYLPRRGPR